MAGDSKSIAIPGWAVRIGSVILAMVLSVGSVWLAMDRQLATQELRLATLEGRVTSNQSKAEQIAVIQRDIEHIREGQQRIETLLAKLSP